jgi:CelD/BcsL family acetyltransferase involved in cellulose biosynthesis
MIANSPPTLNVVETPKPAPRIPALTLDVFDSFAPADGLREAWDQLAVRTKSPIFLSFDWVKIWWEFYGGKRRLRLYVFHDGDDLVAVIPVFIESVGMWPLSLRVARIVGANLPPQLLDLPVLPGFAADVYALVLDHLFRVERCDLLSIGLVPEGWLESAGLGEACTSMAARVAPPRYLRKEVHTTFHLPPTYDEYLNALDSRERKIRRKKLRDLEKERAVRVEVIQDSTRVIDEFEQFADQHTTQWEAEGRPGHFAAWPRGLEFHRALVAAHAKSKRVRFVKLFADDKVVANQYTYAFGDGIYALLPARETSADWQRFSLGGSSQVKLLESSINDGFVRLESGIGHYEYKVLLNGAETHAGTVRVLRSGAWATAKEWLYDRLAELLNLALHKVWYRRIVPRLKLRSPRGRPAILLRFDF